MPSRAQLGLAWFRVGLLPIQGFLLSGVVGRGGPLAGLAVGGEPAPAVGASDTPSRLVGRPIQGRRGPISGAALQAERPSGGAWPKAANLGATAIGEACGGDPSLHRPQSRLHAVSHGILYGSQDREAAHHVSWCRAWIGQPTGRQPVRTPPDGAATCPHSDRRHHRLRPRASTAEAGRLVHACHTARSVLPAS
jgi:hypothetical protein